MMNDSGATVVIGSGQPQPQPHVQAQTVVAGAPVNNNQGCGAKIYSRQFYILRFSHVNGS